MQLLSQRDPKWSQNHLGASQLTVGRYGCTTTCLSMIADYFGTFMSPGQIANHKSWYTPEGLILWNKLAIPKMAFESREYVRNDVHIQEALKDPNRAVLLEVDNGQHWVVALRKTLLGNDYVVADPWFGDKRTACGAYKNVTGAAFFKRV